MSHPAPEPHPHSIPPTPPPPYGLQAVPPPPPSPYGYQVAPLPPRDTTIAYVFWALLGMFGAHNFYVRRTGVAVAQLLMTVFIIGVPVTFVWWIVDAFLLPGYVRWTNAHPWRDARP